ncbi:MAG: transposase domain-containing protein [Verrucomicrobiota bacterium]
MARRRLQKATGQRGAIIYTLVECAKPHGRNREAYLAEMHQRLPAVTNLDDLGALLPSRWQPPRPDRSWTLKPRSV